MHAKGLCSGCYNFVYKSDYIKAWNKRKAHNIHEELYKEKTQKCVICGFDKIVDLHHLDESKDNNSEENLVGLCPNHHKMFHDSRYRQEITEILRNKSFNVPESEKWSYSPED
jgi:predicted HNH restriction endonuclease